MEQKFRLLKAYRDCEQYRKSFNELAKKTFDLNFEDWYQNGFWKENYTPYSIFDGDQAVANVSVNIMNFDFNGELKHYIQLGTVMTEQNYRNQGLIRRIMKEIENDYQGVDGFYLFANNKVLDFYPKFGFQPAEEYQYWKEVRQAGECTARQVPMKERKDWHRFVEIMQSSVSNGSFEMQGNTDLIMFYITKFMQENVFYLESMEAYVVAEFENGTLTVDNIFAKNRVELNDIVKAFGSSVKEVILNFTPLKPCEFQIRQLKEADTTLFVKGEEMKDFSRRKVMFPALSHA